LQQGVRFAFKTTATLAFEINFYMVSWHRARNDYLTFINAGYSVTFGGQLIYLHCNSVAAFHSGFHKKKTG
jgi:hypothetical protein